MSAAVADASHTPLRRRRRDDHFDEPGVHVVDQAGHEETGRERLAGNSNVDPDGCVRVADSLAVQIGHRNLKIIGQLVGIIRKTPDPAVGVMQDYQSATPSTSLGSTLESTQPTTRSVSFVGKDEPAYAPPAANLAFR